MTDLVLETGDRFVVLYDLIALMKQDVVSELALASSAHLSRSVVSHMLALMIAEGYIKMVKNDSEFKVTVLGLNFLEEFKGMRKFLS